MSDTAIVWFRRDLRLADNPALDRARSRHARVVPVYIHDPEAEGDWAPGAASCWWLHHALVDLRERLESRGSALLIRSGSSEDELLRLIDESGACAVYWNRVYEPALVRRDRGIMKTLDQRGIEAESFRAAVLFEPWELLTDDKPYRVFTPFWNRMQRAWRSADTAPEPRELPPVTRDLRRGRVDSLQLLPDLDWPQSLAESWKVGELAARRALDHFVDQRVGRYPQQRDCPAVDGTSRLSPYLHFGQISPAQAVRACEPSGELPSAKGALGFVRELAWREFSTMLLFHYPQLVDTPMQAKFADFAWRAEAESADDLEAWQRGRTGVPLVDAGMRELWATGWMHNRVRMVVASYLTKNLLIPWQHGARWFWDTLVDADLANNTQGWQWTAGCGADAAPYFRVFNPELQAEKFDPRGDYIQRWCPELAGLDSKALARLDHEQRRRRGYPAMRVDLRASRERALRAYEQIRN